MDLSLFGGFQLVDDAGNVVKLSMRKTKALLAWLALHQDKSHPRERLALLLWEESDDRQARHSLRQALSGLRKVLGEHAGMLVADQESVMLRSGHIQVDTLRFEALLSGDHSSEVLKQIVSLYAGEFLKGFNPRSNTYEEWLLTQRSHYRERAMSAMSELLEHYLVTTQLESGVRLAIRLLSSDPLQEQVHRTLMQIYVRLNRPADALRQYRQCRRVLFRELELAPEPETDRLYQEIARFRARQVKETVSPAAPDIFPAAQPAASIDHNSSRNTKASTVPVDDPQQLRSVTVAHLHLSHYLELISEDDPERVHQQTQDLLHQVDRLVQHYGGQLHHQHTNTIAILFGLPVAYGTEGEKAVQIAVELRDEFVARSGKETDALDFQIGIVSGPVVCSGEDPVSGAVFAQAEQLARAGQPGEILLSEATFRGLRLPIEVTKRDDGSRQIVRIHTDSVPDSYTTPFVGRTRELRQIGAALEASIEDQAGETFFMRGEAGIGKTRLVEEVTKQAHHLGIACHKTLVLDFGTELQAEPMPSLLRQLLGVEKNASAEQIKACTRTRLGAKWNETLHGNALHALFRLPLTGNNHEQQEQLTEEARHIGSQQLLRGILESTSQNQPRLLVIEDIHWADQQTLTLLAELAAIVSHCATLLIITSRVEGEPLDPAWRSAMHGAPLTTLDLGPLRQEQALVLAEQLTGGDDEFIQRCIKRSGGNPFFLEQLLWRYTNRNGTVPNSVQSLVLTRLDILTRMDRLAAQAASVLGQRFKLETLRHVLENNDYQADALLNQRMIRPDGENFLFGHALLRDGIYTSLLTSHRRILHLKAAEWYQERDPTLYARHLDLANDERAAEAYLRAAQLAISALNFEQALNLTSRGAEITREPALSVRINNLHGDLLIQAGAINKANQAFEAAANQARDDQDRCRALIGLAAGLTVQDDLNKALEALDQATPLALQSQNGALQTELYYRRGDILFALGRVDDCLKAHQQAERLAKQSNSPLLEIRALAGMADACYAHGQMEKAFHYFDRCIELARREKRLPQELGNLAMRGLTRFYNGSTSDAIADELECARLAAEYGNLRAEMIAHMNLALVYLYTENIHEAELAGRRGLELAHQLGAGRFLGDNLAAIGEALALKGQVDEGVEYLERAYQAALDSVPTYTGAVILGVLARVTSDEERRQQAITQGQRLLEQGSLSHNHLHFYQNLIEVCLNKKDKDAALHYAAALEEYTQDAPLPWSDFYIARGRLLAKTLHLKVEEEHRQQARSLLDTARAAGLYFGTQALEALIKR
ncbi:MAG: BTAD domain-containing putative transcriptional regulator [Pseudomonadota bacterium]